MNRAARRKAGYKKILPGQGEPMQLAMRNVDGQVVIEFGVNLKWFSLGLPEAEEFIAKLQGQVDKLKEPQKETE